MNSVTLKLYAHPFSSYCQKVLTALYDDGTPFEYRLLTPDDPQAAAEHEALWPPAVAKLKPISRPAHRWDDDFYHTAPQDPRPCRSKLP